METGGWCPPDRRNEAGEIPPQFRLQPAPEDRSELAPGVPRSLRTEWNVRDSDATLIVSLHANPVTDPGTGFTKDCAARYGRPLLCVDPNEPGAALRIAEWLRENGIGTLNVAGPKESASPGIQARTCALLTAAFAL